MVLPNRKNFSQYSTYESMYQEEMFETATNQSTTTVGKHFLMQSGSTNNKLSQQFVQSPNSFNSSSASLTMNVDTVVQQPISATIPLPAQQSPPVSSISHISSNGYYGFIQFHQDQNATEDHSHSNDHSPANTMDIEDEEDEANICVGASFTPLPTVDKRKRGHYTCNDSNIYDISNAKKIRISGKNNFRD